MYILTKLVNSFIKKGHKQKSENMIINSFKFLKKKKKLPIETLLNKVIKKCTSEIELKRSPNKRRKIKFPYFVKFKRNKRLTIKNLSKSVNQRAGNGLLFKLNREFKDIFLNKGFTIKKKLLIYNFALKSGLFIRKFVRSKKKSGRKIRRKKKKWF